MTADPMHPDAQVLLSTTAPLAHYMVRNGYAWANIYVRRHPLPAGRNIGNHAIEIVVNSDYGVFGHYWSHAGSGDWRKFVGTLEFEYAMRKLAGERFERHVNKEEFLIAMREKVTAYAAEDSFYASEDTHDRIRTRRANVIAMQDALTDMEGDGDIEHYGDAALFKLFDDKAHGVPYAAEFYDYRYRVPTEACRNFWHNLFAPFQRAILKAYRDEVQP